ncbi:hypothetical protein ACH34R_08380 [Spongiactinospora sp. 9N601]
MNAYKANNSDANSAVIIPAEESVIIAAEEFRLSEVLKHIEAGRIVRIIYATRPPG